jgi:mannose-1-phosphate guanylyltransferase
VEGEIESEGAERSKKILDEVWGGLTKIAIDNAVAEPAALEGRVAVVPATFGATISHSFSTITNRRV